MSDDHKAVGRARTRLGEVDEALDQLIVELAALADQASAAAWVARTQHPDDPAASTAPDARAAALDAAVALVRRHRARHADEVLGRLARELDRRRTHSEAPSHTPQVEG